LFLRREKKKNNQRGKKGRPRFYAGPWPKGGGECKTTFALHEERNGKGEERPFLPGPQREKKRRKQPSPLSSPALQKKKKTKKEKKNGLRRRKGGGEVGISVTLPGGGGQVNCPILSRPGERRKWGPPFVGKKRRKKAPPL